MKRSDRELGMDRPISRRDFLNGATVVAAGALVPGRSLAEALAALEGAGAAGSAYPPLRTGMRGSHPGSFEVAHDLVLNHRSDWGPVREPDTEVYDLIVVGGGISGLAAAYFFREQQPGARILILDNHDDFGGHAKRNEFELGGRTLLGHGGSQSLEDSNDYSDAARSLLRAVGVDTERLAAGYDQGFYRRNGLRAGMYFDRETYGVDRLIPFELRDFSNFLPLAPSALSAPQAVAQMPLSEPARAELLRAISIHENRITDVPAERQAEYLWSISYTDFVARYLGISNPELVQLLQRMTTDISESLDLAPALGAIAYVGLPGINATALPANVLFSKPYFEHFPDGNASVARLLVRALVPGAAPGSTMEDVVTARFDYSQLDARDAKVRLRLDSTAVRAVHDGSPATAKRVAVDYVRGGQAYRVWARSCVLACYNAIIPALCPELPQPQRDALAMAVKVPILYTTVLLRDWRAWQKLGIGGVSAPGSYHALAMLDFPVSLGGYRFSRGPEEPILVHMEHFATRPDAGPTRREQFRAGRHALLATPFDAIEREIRGQLAGMLGGGGFDPARDIEAITVNRWAHGYAYWYDFVGDRDYEAGSFPNEIGRQRFGRIAVANSDAAGRATLDAAIDEAKRAVDELTG